MGIVFKVFGVFFVMLFVFGIGWLIVVIGIGWEVFVVFFEECEKVFIECM